MAVFGPLRRNINNRQEDSEEDMFFFFYILPPLWMDNGQRCTHPKSMDFFHLFFKVAIMAFMVREGKLFKGTKGGLYIPHYHYDESIH